MNVLVTKKVGLIPYNINKETRIISFLLMKPSDPRFGGPDFQIAKGILEPEENELDGAVREAEEELGLKQKNILRIEKLITHTTEETDEENDETLVNKFIIFICEYENIEDLNEYHYETGEIKWLTLKEFEQEGRKIQYQYIKKAFNKIVKDNFSNIGLKSKL